MYPSLDLPWYIAIPAPTWRSWLVFNFMIKKNHQLRNKHKSNML
jgi:hypothetical protein